MPRRPRGARAKLSRMLAVVLRGLVGVAILGVASCGDGGQSYRVIVRFAEDGIAMRGDRIEIALLDRCDADQLGAPPPSSARRLEVLRGDVPPAFGEVEAGRRGLYARVFDEDNCAVIAAGCSPVVLEEGGDGSLVVEIGPIAERTCPGGTRCIEGSCRSVAGQTDGGTGGDAGVPLDGSMDVDAGVDFDAGPGPSGEGWVDVPCPSGPGGFCGDSLAGIYGTCYRTAFGDRCCAGCFEMSTQRCELGATDSHCGWGGNECDVCTGGQTCTDFGSSIHQCR